MANQKKEIAQPSWVHKKWGIAIIMSLGAFVTLFIVFYIMGSHSIGNSNVQDGISTTSSNPSSSSGVTDDTPVTPSIKIENATATLIKVMKNGQSVEHTCIINLSGTVTGPLCSFLTLSAGRTNGEPGALIYPYECPDWRYWGTSILCSRDPGAPRTTAWSITIEQNIYDWEGYKREFIAILDTTNQPVVKSRCTETVKNQTITDSVFLTC